MTGHGRVGIAQWSIERACRTRIAAERRVEFDRDREELLEGLEVPRRRMGEMDGLGSPPAAERFTEDSVSDADRQIDNLRFLESRGEDPAEEARILGPYALERHDVVHQPAIIVECV